MSTSAAPAHAAKAPTPEGEYSHAEILEIMIGLLAGLFTALISSTIVSTALPTIEHSLNGTQRQLTWVITASLLAMTITTPIWGKLSDLFSKKLLVQLALVIFVLGSVAGGLSQDMTQLMAARAVQGLGMGGLTALAQSIIGAIIPPRQRGRYSGYMGAVMAVATISGPLLGGVITDHMELFGVTPWRWCFYVCVPFAIIAVILLQLKLRLPTIKREGFKIDYLGAILLAIGAAAPMLWVTFAGKDYDWISWQTGAFAAVFVVAAALVVVVELKAHDPMVPIRVLSNSTTALMILASLGVGTAMFGMGSFMSQYFQFADGESPTKAGVMTIPMIVAQMGSSVIGGQIVTRTGRWKPIMVFGSIAMLVGLGLMSTIDHNTEYSTFAIYMVVAGLGIGCLVQNIVLAVQNTVDVTDIGAASAAVSFFRSLGGSVGVSVLGAVLANQVTDKTRAGIMNLPPHAQAAIGGAMHGENIDTASLPPHLRGTLAMITQHAYGDSFWKMFFIAGIVAILSLVAVLIVKEVPLRNTVRMQPAEEAVDETETASAQSAQSMQKQLDGDVTTLSSDLSVLTGAGAAKHIMTANGSGAHASQPTSQAAAMAAGGAGDAAASGDASAAGSSGSDSGITVQGFVRGQEGNPVPQASVTLISLGGRQLGRTLAGSDGSYALDAPAAGTYVLIAAADGLHPQVSTVMIGNEPVSFDLLLNGTSGLKGVVRAGENGEPVPGAMVIVTDVRGDMIGSAATGEDGAFTFAELVPGPATVAVNAEGYRPRALPVEIGTTGITRLDVDVVPGARVTGVVRSEHGPLADARVTLVDPAGNVVGTARTGADGAYAFADLDAGDYTVMATGYPPVATTLSVGGRGVEGHEIVLSYPEE